VRTTWLSASVLATVTVLLWATPTAVSRPQQATRPPSYQADCRTVVDGSRATAFCHNPYPVADRVRLHIECARWWDVDVDGVPVELAPAGYVQLSDRCWKEIHAVWVSHQPPRDAAGT
jgi:hypothetical protein